jgi:hypothetical protein
MNKIKEMVIGGDKIFLKKTGKNYKVVHPIKIEGKIVWENLIAGGNWLNLLWIAGLTIFLVGAIWEYSQAVKIAAECIQNNPLYNLPLN